jgi:hypothetical protein
MSSEGKKRHCRRIISVSMLVFLMMPLVTCVSSVSVPQGRAYTPQQQQQQQYPEDTHSHKESPYSLLISCGGSALTENTEEEIDYESIALSLRLTCEMNRQLIHGTNCKTCDGGHVEVLSDSNGYDNSIYVHPSQTWFYPIHPPESNNDKTPLSLFQAKSP